MAMALVMDNTHHQLAPFVSGYSYSYYTTPASRCMMSRDEGDRAVVRRLVAIEGGSNLLEQQKLYGGVLVLVYVLLFVELF